ncbi:thiamine-phosphate kinase [Leifsonia sp. 1010]|uniref:thiamine-phosphate kinase n=1 Tax=Leifsonia sp. 1010 TaxID=2817769 RepID=UPI002854F067|nr:thiamine-phosphate kinase [Leifsonia sp. 1010]MDR6612948.1 thiamine-monophosphate kinase [Leifsonia sp. 1010]
MGISGSDAAGITIGEASEREALKRIFPRLPDSSATLVGPGDDAAVLAAPDGRFVVTTDMMVHGPDFRLAWSGPADLGWKAAATNLSDVAAMGAVPTALVVAIAAPPETPVAWLEGVADGFRLACTELAPGCGVVGGDLSVSQTLTIAVTAFGDLGGRRPVLRSGARPGDVVAVSGALGQAAAGLRTLFTDAVDAAGEPDSARLAAVVAAHPDTVSAQLRPRPPIADGPLAADAGATAMLDLSDGLALDARRVAEASGVAIDLDPAALGSDPRTALTGGEDHGLLATFPSGTPLPGGFRPIGTVRDGAGLLVAGTPFDERGGWDPYLEWDGRRG